MRNERSKRKLILIFRSVFIALFLGVIAYSLFQIIDTNNNYVKEQRVREQMEQFKPQTPEMFVGKDAEKPPAVVNQSIIDARKLNPDIVGWLTMDGTRIDYPFVKAEDNDYYLRRDVNGEYSYAGTAFMDYRCADDFSDFTSVVYGHNMGNGTMFSDVKSYSNSNFFAVNDSGWLYLENATYKLDVFAYITVQGDDDIIYSAGNMDDYNRQQFLTYIQKNALHYRDLLLTASDRFVVLSTCTDFSGDLRSVVIARLIVASQQK